MRDMKESVKIKTYSLRVHIPLYTLARQKASKMETGFCEIKSAET